MKALSIQVQPRRAPTMDVEAVAARFDDIARKPELVKHHQFDRGYDRGEYLNFTFGTEDLAALWGAIEQAIYRDQDLGAGMAIASMAMCEGERGWGDYRLLYHFDPAVTRDAL